MQVDTRHGAGFSEPAIGYAVIWVRFYWNPLWAGLLGYRIEAGSFLDGVGTHPDLAASPNGATAWLSDTEGMASGDNELRCVIVDDDPRYIAIATRLLQRGGISIIGTASTIAEALQRVEELRPDITLVDVNLGGESGLHLAVKLHQANSHSGLKIILTSAQPEQDFAGLIAASPAVGFVPKDYLSPAAIHDLLAAS